MFFDVEYSVRTIPTEMVAMSLVSTAPDATNPQGAIDAVKNALKEDVFYGHVTILK